MPFLDPISWSHSGPYLMAALVFGYLMGSVPYGLLFTKAAGLGDIRAIGSGNIGATNVLRTGRKGLAAATLLADALKGTLAVLIAGRWGPETAMLAGLGAFLGHVAPVWLRFKGGKGVATYIGVILALHGPAVVVFAAAWLTTAFVTRISSLSALLACLLVPVATWFGPGIALASGERFGAAPEPRLAMVFALLSLIVIAKHHANIRRLLAGTETRIGGGKR